MREYLAGICEGSGVKLPRSTRRAPCKVQKGGTNGIGNEIQKFF